MNEELPVTPYWAVIFSNTRTPDDDEAYHHAAERMVELVQNMPGFLGFESARGADGFGITVSYWRSEADITYWRNHVEHLAVQEKGISQWYQSFTTRVAQVSRQKTHP